MRVPLGLLSDKHKLKRNRDVYPIKLAKVPWLCKHIEVIEKQRTVYCIEKYKLA